MVLFNIRPPASGSGFSVLLKNVQGIIQHLVHYEYMPIQIYRKKLIPKTEYFHIKNGNIFLISAPNIDCGYSLEPPW